MRNNLLFVAFLLRDPWKQHVYELLLTQDVNDALHHRLHVLFAQLLDAHAYERSSAALLTGTPNELDEQ